MKKKYISTRLAQCKVLSNQSTCTRKKIAAIIIDPESNTIIADGYNGPPRGGGTLCGGNTCSRTDQNIISGTHMEVGCHHAEMNAICNAARVGTKTLGTEIIITAEPCAMCARAIHHAGITKVYALRGQYGHDGIEYLQLHGIPVVDVTD